MKSGTPPPQEDKKTIYQGLRAKFFPIHPTDSTLVKAGKTAGFFVFGAFLLLVSLMVGLAVAFVL
ncbi:hypothetical protein V9K67_20955 [Paraflavisolibacter sp. H34]|uniref:hypothetical protein n=1 Tax=Huijunlia imazamoxiresistens TaxID=3127457 RepID=UPI003017042B